MPRTNLKMQKPSQTANVITPPPLIYLSAIVLGIILGIIYPFNLFAERQVFVGIFLVIISFVLFYNSLMTLKKANTPIQPNKPTTAIANNGPYAFSRNPVYLSFSIFQIAIAFLANSLWILMMIIPSIAVVRYGVIKREEMYLEDKFGKKYLDYKKKVRRWV